MRIIAFALLMFSAPISRAADADCPAAAPVPLLRSSGYPDHHFAAAQDNAATESAGLPGGVVLVIRHYGCADVRGQEFIFTVARSRFPLDSMSDAVAFAGKELAQLKVTDRGESVRSALLRFLAKTPRLKASRDGKLKICLDGSVPDREGCAFRTGGGNEFGARRSLKAVSVSVSNYGTL